MWILTKRATTALLLAASAGIVSLVSPPDLFSQVTGLMSGEGRGDNPVVGSLPCAVDDDLDLKFFNWMGIQRPPGVIQFHEPTLAFVGGPDLVDSILDAQGTPTGMVNASTGWTALGSIRDMQVVANRADAGKAYVVTLWVPDRFIGGTIQSASNLGGATHTVMGNAFALPVGALAALPGPVANGNVTVTTADGSESCAVSVAVVAGQVIVDFQP